MQSKSAYHMLQKIQKRLQSSDEPSNVTYLQQR
jgi:hypothetical protein